MQSLLSCEVCKKSFKSITNTHLKRHNISFEDYKNRYSNSKVVTKDTINKRVVKMVGRKVSEETKKKISEASKGKIIKEETRNKLSKALKGRVCSEERKQKLRDYYKTHDNPFKGKIHTSETKRTMSLAHRGKMPWNKGKSWSEETKSKISAKLQGNKLSMETRNKMSISRKGRYTSEITREKLSIALKGKKKAYPSFFKGKKLTIEHKNKILESLNRSPNKFEEKCITLFKNHNLPLRFVGGFKEKNFFIAGKVPDFVSTNDKKVIVEVFYEYFKIKQYGSIENYKKDRIDTFSRYGWKTLFFSTNEINFDFDKCLEILKKELE